MDSVRFYLFRYRWYLAAATTAAALLLFFTFSSSTNTATSPTSAPTTTPKPTYSPADPSAPLATAPDGLPIVQLPPLPSPPAANPSSPMSSSASAPTSPTMPSPSTIPLTLDQAATTPVSSSPAYRLAPLTAADVEALATNLGVTDPITAVPDSAGGGFKAGSLLVTKGGTFSFSPTLSTGQPQATPTSLQPVSDLPTDEDVLKKFNSFAPKGMTLSPPRVDRTPFSVIVSARYVLSGMDTGALLVATFGQKSALLSLSGVVGRFEKLGEYPVSSPAAALKAADYSARLRDRTMCFKLASCRVKSTSLGLEVQVDSAGRVFLLPVHLYLDETDGTWSLPALTATHLNRG